MRPVALRLCVLNTDRESHDDGSVQVKRLLDVVHRSEFYITDATAELSAKCPDYREVIVPFGTTGYTVGNNPRVKYGAFS